ncbi:AlbA family DNA-binding domain-containing protein [Acinetobacter sp. WZC-1]|uniref:AlbA family DNA-binding domain-containing protein n=1 Tax=Acinetobacter sp. WZC-1 TaxID=3459034 RepID=UPI00403DBE7B
MELDTYISNKFKKFNDYLETHWQSQPYKFKEIQTLLFFQAFSIYKHESFFKLRLHENYQCQTLNHYFLRIEKYLQTPAKELFPSSFHRPYEFILKELKYLSFYQPPQEINKKIELIRDIHQKISIPVASHDIYQEIMHCLNLTFEYLTDTHIPSESKIKIIYQWQNVHNLETASAYKSLYKIQNVLNNYQHISIAEKYKLMISEGENNRVEFKERTTDLLTTRKSDKWIKACIAFMNTRKGYVFIGVADDLSITGVENELEHFHNSLDLMKRSLTDKLAHETNRISNIYTTLEDIRIDGKTILVFKCNKADRPLYYKNELYMRSNGQTTRIPSELIECFKEEFYC